MDPRFRLALVGVGWLVAAAHSQTVAPAPAPAGCEVTEGAVVRGPKEGRRLALVFTGHEFAEGGTTILDELAKHRARASFFLTGDFLANPRFQPIVRRIVDEGHYLGPHSDKHLLYCTWDKDRKTLVSRAAFATDLSANLEKVARFGADRPRYFLPPYEHSNKEIAAWTAALGLQLVNFTPGTRSNADYTEESAPNFVSSRAIFESIIGRERQGPRRAQRLPAVIARRRRPEADGPVSRPFRRAAGRSRRQGVPVRPRG